MKQRIITSIVILLVVIPVLIFSEYVVYPLLMSFLSAVAVYETLRIQSWQFYLPVCIPSYLLSAALPIFAYYYMRSHSVIELFAVVMVALIAFMFYLFAVAVLSRGRRTASAFFEVIGMYIYIVISFVCLTALRYVDHGVYTFLIVFLAAWGCDVFAYFTGYFLGKHKLIPEISPKKTVEGSIGGVIAAMIILVAYGAIVSRISGDRANYLVLALSGAVLSILAQVGDLFASLIKREHGLKDYGTLMPGHGGVLDRFDSILPLCSVMLFITVIAPPFS